MTQRLFLNKDLEASHVGDLQVWGDKGLLSSVARGQNSRGSVPLWHVRCDWRVQVVSLCCTFLPRVGVLGHPAVPQAEHSLQSLKWRTTECGFTPWRCKRAAEGCSSSLQEDNWERGPGGGGRRGVREGC